jgi:tRNA/tmRNA/rRNA uracil-C5-methylase (TrmA/RlmC/RlmD family)
LLLCEGQNERGEVSILGKPLKIDVAGFFQSNAATLETLLRDFLEIAASEAGEGKRAIDLYCGVGTFGAFLADLFPSVDLVELISGPRPSPENVRGKNVRLFAFSDDEWAKRGKNAGAAYDFAVVDPQGSGFPRRRGDGLRRGPPRTLAYVSCDRDLARDAKDLCAEAFELSALTLYDFYPKRPTSKASLSSGGGIDPPVRRPFGRGNDLLRRRGRGPAATSAEAPVAWRQAIGGKILGRR